MGNESNSLQALHKSYIAGTINKEYVFLKSICLTSLRHQVKKKIHVSTSKTFISTKVLKHIYDRHYHDKKQTAIYHFIVKNLHEILKNPDIIRKDKEGKKKMGRIVFIKSFDDERYACTIKKSNIRKGKKLLEVLSVVTAFKTKNDGNYLSETSILYKKD